MGYPSAIGFFYMQVGIGSLIGNQLAGWLLQRGFRFSLIGIGSVLMGTVLMLSTQDLLPGPWMGGMFFGIMLGGSICSDWGFSKSTIPLASLTNWA